MPTAVVIHETGGPEVLKLEPVEVGRPMAGELRIRQTAIGVNFHDIYVRSGLYRTAPVGYIDQPAFINAAVLLETRRYFLEKYTNPMGFVYGLYAGSDQRFLV